MFLRRKRKILDINQTQRRAKTRTFGRAQCIVGLVVKPHVGLIKTNRDHYEVS